MAATVPFQDGFEGQADGTPLNTLSGQGWGAESDAVVIRTVTNVADAARGTNAVAIPGWLTVSNVLTAEPLSNVWVDLYVDTALGTAAELAGEESVDPAMTAQVFFETNGCPVVWNPASNAWVVCTQDVWQTDVAAFHTSSWARLTFCQNYADKTAALFMNGHLLVADLRFIDTNRTSCGRFEAQGGVDGTSYFDELAVSYTPPAGLADLDNDGMSEAAEIQAYGSVTNRHRPVIAVSAIGDGAVMPGGAFDVLPGATTNFLMIASNGCYVAEARTNGQSVGSFTGQYTGGASFEWPAISPDGLVDAAFEVVFTANPLVTVTPPLNGAVSPMDPAAYPFTPVVFTLTAGDGYYVAGVSADGVDVGGFPGRYTAVGSYTWPSLAPTGGVLDVTYLRKLQLTAAAVADGGPSLTGGTLALSATEAFPGGQVTCAMTGELGYVVSAVLTNGGVAAAFGAGTRVRSHTLTNLWSDLTVTAVFRYSAHLDVPTDFPTLQAAVAAATPGTTLGVAGGTYSNTVTLDKSLTLQGTNVTLAGALELQNGVTGTLSGCEGLVISGVTTVVGGALLVVSNGSADVGSLVIEAGGTVQVFNATAFVADGATLTGTFTLDSGWGTTVVPQVPPCSDPFERYASGTRMNRMGHFGWSAPAAGIVVQDALAQSNRAVQVPAGAVFAGVMDAAASPGVWIEVYCQDTNRTPDDQAAPGDVDTNVAVAAFISAAGFLTVFDPELGQWDVCSNDVQGVAVPALAPAAWPRLTFHQDYARGRAALFLDGRLLRNQLRFINTNLVAGSRFEVEAGYAGATVVDTYSVRTNWVGVVSGDVDGDGIPDAFEIDRYGAVNVRPAGSVFRFR